MMFSSMWIATVHAPSDDRNPDLFNEWVFDLVYQDLGYTANPTVCKPPDLWLFRHLPSSTEKLPRGLLFAKTPIKILLKSGINAV